MKFYVVRNAVINIFLVVIGISCMSADRFDGSEEERSLNVIKARPALCQPGPQVVSVVDNDDSTQWKKYFPNCVRINRCGGCCNVELMSCQPTRTEIRNFEIRVLELEIDGTLARTSSKIVQLEEHIECQCGCTKKAKDCTDKQYYLPKECICRCSNSDEGNKCLQQSQLKYWDPNNCSCHCRQVEECNTSSKFDTNSCRCVRTT